ncbi:MAG: rhodanese-like domain-containing protein [Myxococcales bacterium]|nr:rhodanese-like domain-containing protein [Polyangiaceae bacterium]MDW8248998.1 rhodanese-like domain-containing protein [Myxococcales bacterium]
MSLFDQASPTPQGFRDVTPAQVHEYLGKVRIVDVREPSEFTGELGHIPGAELVPLATVTDQASSWNRSADLVLVCRSGGRSGRAAAALAAMGFQRVMNMVGGMLAYKEAGLPRE